MSKTIKVICQHLIADSVLQQFSYLGRRDKLCFKKYDNITKLIVRACSDSMLACFTGTKKEKKEKKLEIRESATKYFTTQYIKHATERFAASIK